ncbi:MULTISPECIES: DUF3817 domain-containing protein [unclassified Frankia]|uniref:DUF3817 domain-containing protein n=1 Tax=unclassified Frankia TaxID=2632575 RepID=UPI00202461FD
MPADGAHRRSDSGDQLLAAARLISIAEATSFLLLLAATVIKHTADHPGGVRVLGPIHGVLFLAYCALIVAVATTRHWATRRTLLALGASVLPVAPYFVERRWLRAPAAGRTADAAHAGPGAPAASASEPVS